MNLQRETIKKSIAMLPTTAPLGRRSKSKDKTMPEERERKEKETERTILCRKEEETKSEVIAGMDIKLAESTSPTAFMDRATLAEARAIRE
ncbi:hypothetical protein A7N06_21450 [Acinetobacter baumannii]|nr:hypothetical protein A7N06_21450 [Acinetobacter baumannii]